MTRARVIVLAAALALGASCGERVCTNGQRRSCVCPDGTQAIQACGADGQYGACACAGAPSDLAAADASGMDLSSSDLPAGDLPFGAMCAGPGLPGCAAGLFCDRFAMGTVFRCTRMCPGGCDATCCPSPSTGTCNGKGECKFTM
jgi:hypothetical protein